MGFPGVLVGVSVAVIKIMTKSKREERAYFSLHLWVTVHH